MSKALEPSVGREAVARWNGLAAEPADGESSAPAPDEDDDPERLLALETLTLTGLGLLEPYPWGNAARATDSSQLNSHAWKNACTPLLREVLHIAMDERSTQTRLALTSRSKLLLMLIGSPRSWKMQWPGRRMRTKMRRPKEMTMLQLFT